MQATAVGRVSSGTNRAGDPSMYAATNRRILWQNMTGETHSDPFRRLAEAFAAMARSARLYPGALAERSGAAVETLRGMDTWATNAPPDMGDVLKLLVFFGIQDQPVGRWFAVSHR